MTLDSIPQIAIGLSLSGATGILAIRLLRILTRYNVLLTGHSLGEIDSRSPPADDSAASHSTPPFCYRLRLQSLEPTLTEYPIRVTIRGFPDGSNTKSPAHHVWVAAGKKSIHVRRTLGKVPTDKQPDDASDEPDPNDASNPYVWQAVFPELPALDAWSFDVVMPCERLEIAIGLVGAEPPKLLTPTFGPYFEPNRLTVFATDRGEPRVSGPLKMPRAMVPFILSSLTVLVYVLVRTLSLTNLRIELFELEWLDGALLGAALFFIWIGYYAIRRPVYPVISGYRFITPPFPDADRPLEYPSNPPSHTADTNPQIQE